MKFQQPHYPWSKIRHFHDARKDIQRPTQFRAKVKLHGTNAAIGVFALGDDFSHVTVQGRSSFMDEKSFGGHFYKLVYSLEKELHQIRAKIGHDIIIYGELCGEGIQKGSVACSKIPEHCFFIYAVKIIACDGVSENIHECDPVKIGEMCEPILGPRIHVIPWEETSVVITPGGDNRASLATINDMTEAIDKHDHYIEKLFGVSGTGEGYVWYATKAWYDSSMTREVDGIRGLRFKTKGISHLVVKTKRPAVVSLPDVSSLDEYLDLYLTKNRYEQGLAESGCDGTLKTTLQFAEWVVKDVISEADDRQNGFTGLERRIKTRAAKWYRETIDAGDNVVLNALRRPVASSSNAE